MTQDAEAPIDKPELSHHEEAPKGKPYRSPELLEWGSIIELTAGPLADISDDGFSSSGGV